MIAQSLTVLKSFGLVTALVGLVFSSQISAAASGGVFNPIQSAPSPEEPPAAQLAEPTGPNTPLIGCGESAGDSWTNSTDTFSTVRECSLTVPDDGLVFISTDASVANSGDGSRGEFDVSIDSTTSGVGAPRWVDVRDDGNGGQRMVLARTATVPLATGSHTIRLLGRSLFPPDTVHLEDSSLSAIFVPDSSDLLVCYDNASEWSTSSSTYGGILKCSLKVPENGWAFITADATVRWQQLDQDLELAFDFDDATSPEGATRFIGAHTGTWSFSPAALSLLKPVKKGDRIFYLVGRRDQGAGQIDVYHPALNVIYIPSASAYALTCGASDTDLWSHTSSTWKEIAKCSLPVPTDAWAFVSASSSVNYSDGPYQGEFKVNIGTLESTSRVVNIYDNDDFGKDNTVAASLLKPIEAGTHSFTFEARRASGTATMQLYRPTLTAIVPLSTLYAPVLSTPADGATLCSGQPTFTWNGVDGATSHQIQIDNDPTFGSPEIDETVMGASYTVTPAQEILDGRHHWRVRGLSPSQTGPWSAAWNFSVGPPVAPTPQSPADGATIEDTTPEFRWSSVQGGTEYRLRVGRDASFSSVALDVNVAGTSHTPAAVLANGTYWWMVQAHNTCAWGDWSATWKVTVDEKQHYIYLPLLSRESARQYHSRVLLR